MGLANLWLVNPCDHLSKPARKTGYRSHDILERALVFGDLEEAVRELEFVVGTTAKKRDGRHDYHHPGKLSAILHDKSDSLRSVGFVFGREDRGLSNHELDLCDLISTIPMNDNYPSLNLSHAIMIYAYEIANLHSNSLGESEKPGTGEMKELKRAAKELFHWLDIDPKVSLTRRMMDRLALVKSTDVHLLLSLWKSLKHRRDQSIRK